MTKKRMPSLRFKGFDDEWVEKEFKNIITVNNGCDYKHLHNGEIPVYGTGGYMLNVDKALSYKENAVGIGRKGTINKPYILHAPFWTVDTLFYCIPHSNNDLKFIYCLFQIIDWKSKDQSTGVPSLSKEIIISSSIAVTPNKTEQTQIGEFFKNIDQLISVNQKKYDKLINIKKALLERMFPQQGETVPKLRFDGFSDEWVEKKLGECVLIQRGGSPRPIEDYITTESTGINWIKIGDVSANARYITKTKEKIRVEGEKKSRRVIKGDLILSNSMSFGRPYIMQIEGCIHDGWLLIRDENQIFFSEYLLQLLSSNYTVKQYRQLASGGVVNNLNSELVQSTKVVIPCKPEQTQIGKLFKQVDSLINLQQQKLNKLKNIKKACLEKMFV